jgi:microcystin-dependent protein
MEGTIAEIRMFTADFAPKNWAFCRGQLLPIAQNQPLYSLLGTTYGGNGTVNFALPDLQGRVPVGAGQGAGLSNYSPGQKAGTESTLLTPDNLPAHNHPVTGTIKVATTNLPANEPLANGKYFANDGSPKFNLTNTGNAMKPANLNMAISSVGNSQALENRMPYIGINYIICLQGIYPSRD